MSSISTRWSAENSYICNFILVMAEKLWREICGPELIHIVPISVIVIELLKEWWSFSLYSEERSCNSSGGNSNENHGDNYRDNIMSGFSLFLSRLLLTSFTFNSSRNFPCYDAALTLSIFWQMMVIFSVTKKKKKQQKNC